MVAADAEAPLDRVLEANALVGRGLEGDRYVDRRGTFNGAKGYDLTLIQAEAFEQLRGETGIELAWEEARRNIVTSGIDLNELVGKRFRVGGVECIGDRLAEPCSHLERLTQDGVLAGLFHRGGLRADIVVGGVIRPGDSITTIDG